MVNASKAGSWARRSKNLTKNVSNTPSKHATLQCHPQPFVNTVVRTATCKKLIAATHSHPHTGAHCQWHETVAIWNTTKSTQLQHSVGHWCVPHWGDTCMTRYCLNRPQTFQESTNLKCAQLHDPQQQQTRWWKSFLQLVQPSMLASLEMQIHRKTSVTQWDLQSIYDVPWWRHQLH